MSPTSYSFTGEVWKWKSRTSWFFVNLPEDLADDIEERFGRRAAGFGSVRVDVTIGTTVWQRSIFPLKGSRCDPTKHQQYRASSMPKHES